MNIFSLLLVYALMTILVVSLIGIILFFLHVAIGAERRKKPRKKRREVISEDQIPF